ncbi:hypothetical protein TorRG33x02_164400 [Trema orientale]|uniref:Uncharacterized protein n=1 Tax=Trema orientale TaxID=63057 RepID=A0A2P5EQI7_TREOI|nr:hypothetical protein TorRG33x02_164400 [Trema orientale]
MIFPWPSGAKLYPKKPILPRTPSYPKYSPTPKSGPALSQPLSQPPQTSLRPSKADPIQHVALFNTTQHLSALSHPILGPSQPTSQHKSLATICSLASKTLVQFSKTGGITSSKSSSLSVMRS